MVSGTFVPVCKKSRIKIFDFYYLFIQIQKAFPTEAVKNIHDKPGTHPKHEAHAYKKHDEQRFMNQPGKQ